MKATTSEVPEPLDEGVLTIFVDGSMREAPRRGGIGIRFVWINEDGNESEPWDHPLPSTEGATIQQMELEAPYQALKLALSSRAPFELHDFRKIEIRTDSLYVKEGVGRAINYWARNGWMTKEGNAVQNVPDWQNLLRIMRRLRNDLHVQVDFEWKKGKKGRHAKAVDKLAKQSSHSSSFGQSRPTAVRRKITKEKVDPGSVRMEGQTITIRIVEARYLKRHNRTRYRYEVVDKESPYLGKVDFAESELELSRGHTYLVRMNDIQATPRVVDLVEEVEEDLSHLIEALRTIGQPATAREVLDALTQAGVREMKVDAVKRRLDRLAEETEIVTRLRSVTSGRAYVYALVRDE